jgi:hypothetical protein
LIFAPMTDPSPLATRLESTRTTIANGQLSTWV